MIPDVPATIVRDEINCRRGQCLDYVFTTGGIRTDTRRHHQRMRRRRVWGAVGAASGGLGAHGASATSQANSAPRACCMATMPRGATLIDNALSVAPGFPDRQRLCDGRRAAGTMQSMFEWLAPRLQGGPKIEQRAVHAVGLPEGLIAEELERDPGAVSATSTWSSYPFYRPGGNGVALVAKW